MVLTFLFSATDSWASRFLSSAETGDDPASLPLFFSPEPLFLKPLPSPGEGLRKLSPGRQGRRERLERIEG